MTKLILEKIRKIPIWSLIAGVFLLIFFTFLFSSIQDRTFPNNVINSGSGTTVSISQTLNVFIRLSFVVFTMYVGLIVLRKWKKEKFDIPYRSLIILESVHLNPHQSIHLIQVLGQQMLIGCTNQTITCLSIFGSTNETAEKNFPIVSTSSKANDSPQSFPNYIMELLTKQ